LSYGPGKPLTIAIPRRIANQQRVRRYDA